MFPHDCIVKLKQEIRATFVWGSSDQMCELLDHWSIVILTRVRNPCKSCLGARSDVRYQPIINSTRVISTSFLAKILFACFSLPRWPRLSRAPPAAGIIALSGGYFFLNKAVVSWDVVVFLMSFIFSHDMWGPEHVGSGCNEMSWYTWKIHSLLWWELIDKSMALTTQKQFVYYWQLFILLSPQCHRL